MAKQAPDTDKGRDTVRDQMRFQYVLVSNSLWYFFLRFALPCKSWTFCSVFSVYWQRYTLLLVAVHYGKMGPCLTAGFWGGYSQQLLFMVLNCFSSDYNNSLAITPLVHHLHPQSAKGKGLVYHLQHELSIILLSFELDESDCCL